MEKYFEEEQGGGNLSGGLHGAELPERLASVLEDLGPLAGPKLSERPQSFDGRSRFEMIWEEARKGKGEHPREWARVALLMAQAGECVNRILPGGNLPMVEMAGWGDEFFAACEAFSLAGASCWKKDARRRSLVDASQRFSKLGRQGWLLEAMARDDCFETTSAKRDLQLDDILSGPDPRELAKPALEEWAGRFEWEAQRRSSSFDLECAWILTSRFSARQALSVWRRALGDAGVSRQELSVWVIGCMWGSLSDLPTPDDLRPLSTKAMSLYLGRAALVRAKEDGSAKDPERMDLWIKFLLDACEACGVEFDPVVLAKQAAEWRREAQFSQRGFEAADSLDAAVERACARWEARVLNQMLPPAPQAARARHL